MSDNGFLLGEHRIPPSKVIQYEPSVRVPMLMAGPDVPQAGVRRQLVGIHDLASTITTWLGLRPMPGADGADLGPVLSGQTSDRELLFEGYFDRTPRWNYVTLRTPTGLKYTELANGQRELYDLRADPNETENLAERPRYAPPVDKLAQRLHTLRSCARDTCR